MKKMPFFFIQMSDPQFGMLPMNGDIFQEIQLFEKALAHINRLSPAFVISTGDFINDPGNEKQLVTALKIKQKLKNNIPFYMIPGNHDIGDAPTEQSLDWYRKNIGADWCSFDYGNSHFIGLNSCIIVDDRNAMNEAQKQWQWLNLDLQRASAKNIIIFVHHPFFLKNDDEQDDYWNIPKKTRHVYMDLFHKYNIKKIFAGHLHQNNLAANSPIEVITTAAVGMPLGSAFSGFRIVKVCDDQISHKYFGLDEIPNCDF